MAHGTLTNGYGLPIWCTKSSVLTAVVITIEGALVIASLTG